MISVSESTGWSGGSSVMSKYRALRCHIEPLLKNTVEYEAVEEILKTEPDMK
jgi:hypothetical protein